MVKFGRLGRSYGRINSVLQFLFIRSSGYSLMYPTLQNDVTSQRFSRDIVFKKSRPILLLSTTNCSNQIKHILHFNSGWVVCVEPPHASWAGTTGSCGCGCWGLALPHCPASTSCSRGSCSSLGWSAHWCGTCCWSWLEFKKLISNNCLGVRLNKDL